MVHHNVEVYPAEGYPKREEMVNVFTRQQIRKIDILCGANVQ